MSKRYNVGSHYQNHQRAAELQDPGEHAHRVAEQEHGKEEHLTGHEHSRQEQEHLQEHFNGPAKQTHGHTAVGNGAETFGHTEIAALAYKLWEQRGRPAGSPEEDWFQAAQLLRSRMPVH